MKTLCYYSLFIAFLINTLGCKYLDGLGKHEFYDEIKAFKEKDQLHTPPLHPILFIGSSSVRRWKSVEPVFKDYQVLNRGFGGAKLTDLHYYLNDVVFKYKPRQIILYAGDNDIAFDGVDAETVFIRFKKIYEAIRQKMPDVPFIYMSIKPSPGRRQILPIQIKSNKLIKDYLQTQKDAQFVDIFPLMLDRTGNASPDIVIADSIHLNQKGYLIWETAIRPYLLK
jgi:lysophospholipase L1-like esterase